MEKFAISVNGYYGYADYDKSNPIYGKTREDDRYVVEPATETESREKVRPQAGTSKAVLALLAKARAASLQGELTRSESFMERALRKIHIQYPRRQVGMKVYDGGSSHLPIKVNPAGVIPAIFASSLLLLPVTISTFSGNSTSPVMSWLLANFGPGQPLYLLFFIAMIVFFAYFYTFNVAFKPDDVADNLKNQNGFVPGIRPGKKTAEYLEYVVNRVLVLGSAYLAAVCILPEILRGQFAIPFYFGGTSVLIVVSVTMDTIQQVQSHLLAHQYEGLLEKSQLRGKSGKGRKKRSPARK